VNDHPILLVEDNPDDVVLTLLAFKKNNIRNEIIVVTNGAEALDVLLPEDARPPLQPALVLLDVKLPKIGGLEVLRRMRADPRTRSLPVVVLTTSSEESDIVSTSQRPIGIQGTRRDWGSLMRLFAASALPVDAGVRRSSAGRRLRGRRGQPRGLYRTGWCGRGA
jgi:two-component system response regulator